MFRNLIRWARVTMAGADDGQFPVQQVGYKGKTADSLLVFPYGVHANVPPGALALMFGVEGDPDNRAGIAWTPQNRPQLAEGEVAYYHPPTGTIIKLAESGDLEITTGNEAGGNVTISCTDATVTASGSVTVDSPETTITGNATVQGDLQVDGATTLSATVTSNGKDISDTHTHGGVTPGGGTSGPPV